jgi:hypothetical protein
MLSIANVPLPPIPSGLRTLTLGGSGSLLKNEMAAGRVNRKHALSERLVPAGC